MRNTARIDRICDLLKKVWHNKPDMRLGQLMHNFVFNDNVNMHNIEDSKVEFLISELLKEACPHCEEEGTDTLVGDRHICAKCHKEKYPLWIDEVEPTSISDNKKEEYVQMLAKIQEDAKCDSENTSSQQKNSDN